MLFFFQNFKHMVSVILLISGSVLIWEIVWKRVSLIATSHLKRTYPVVSWECHINEISKIASGISAIKRVRYFLPFELLLNVYNSLVQPHFDYCNVVWGNCSENLSSKLQNRAARVLTFSNYDCSTIHQRAVSKAIMMHSIVNNTAPEYLTSVSYTHLTLPTKRIV